MLIVALLVILCCCSERTRIESCVFSPKHLLDLQTLGSVALDPDSAAAPPPWLGGGSYSPASLSLSLTQVFSRHYEAFFLSLNFV